MSDKESLTSTHEWLRAVSEELGVDPELTRTAVGPVLDMTANVAHNGPSRPAAPTTAFVLGYALAQKTHRNEETPSAEDLAALIADVDTLLERYGK